MKEEDWINLGLTSQIRVFHPFQAICKINETALTVYLILDGEIAVTKLRKKTYTKNNLTGKVIAVMKPGISFGEIAVLYKIKR